MELKKRKLQFEGKTKKIYSTNDPEHIIIFFKDDVISFDGKKGTIKGKGEHNAAMSSVLFKYLEGYHIHTHFVQMLRPNEMVVKKLEIIPVRSMVRNTVAGSLNWRFNLEEGKPLVCPILEFYIKDDKLDFAMINMDHACAFGYAKLEEMQTIDLFARKINAVLKSFFNRRGLKLVDIRLEFGRYQNKILLADEISPDTCRFWDVRTSEKFGRDRFRYELDNTEEAFQEIRNRVCQ